MNEICSESRKHSVSMGPRNRRITSYVRDGKTDSHNSSKLCENVGISTSAMVRKCHYQADMVLNLNSTSLFGKSSAEERIKVLIKLHARGGFYVYIPAMNLSPLRMRVLFLLPSTFFSCVSQKLIQLLWHFMAVLFIRDQRGDASSVNLAQAGSFAARNRERGTKRFDDLTPLVREDGPGVCRWLCPHHWWRKCKVLITFCFVCVQERRNKS